MSSVVHGDRQVICTNVFWDQAFAFWDFVDGQVVFKEWIKIKTVWSMDLVIHTVEPLRWIPLNSECFLPGVYLWFHDVIFLG